jgi:uncharacterized repeat protein (TIGR04076 family)
MSQSNEMLEIFKAALNYNDEEMSLIKSNPKYMQIIEKLPHVISTEFVFEVTEAHGCGCQHKPGQKIIINGNNSLSCKESPEQICIYLLQAITPIIYGAQEFIYAGLDPNELKFTKVGCFDNGVKCGGFGHVSVNFKSRQK